MDILLLRTFLELAKIRHFGKVASSLFVTQSAVSARIKHLETLLGVDLFIRKRGDLQLTVAGHRLQRHAETIVRAWSRARQDIALESSQSDSIAIGCTFDLWPIFVKSGCLDLQRLNPGLLLQLEVMTQDILVQRLTSGLLDLIFLFEPPRVSELLIRKLVDVPLVMVSSKAGLDADQAIRFEYILVDWGISFSIQHADSFTDETAPAVRTTSGSQALDLMLLRGGTAYLARQMVEDHLARGVLHEVADAPVLLRHIYLAIRPESEKNQAIIGAIACFEK